MHFIARLAKCAASVELALADLPWLRGQEREVEKRRIRTMDRTAVVDLGIGFSGSNTKVTSERLSGVGFSRSYHIRAGLRVLAAPIDPSFVRQSALTRFSFSNESTRRRWPKISISSEFLQTIRIPANALQPHQGYRSEPMSVSKVKLRPCPSVSASRTKGRLSGAPRKVALTELSA